MHCGKEMKVWVATGHYSAKEVTVKCGNTQPSGYPYLCDPCEKIHENTDWRAEARENGENFDEDY